MTSQFDLYFAGLARNASGTVEDNIKAILSICDQLSVSVGKLLIAENDSHDNTREILKSLERDYPSIELFLFDNLDTEFPDREQRIAFVRDHLFSEICDRYSDSTADSSQFYVPIDLDSSIAQSIEKSVFLDECEYVADSNVDAVFPVSRPRYYDLYALRADGWVETNCWEKVRESRGISRPLFPIIKHVYSKQKKLEDLQKIERISVDSAFGGVGIYDLSSTTNTSYRINDNLPTTTCEHVIFNSKIDSKEISTKFVVEAPPEHIKYHLSVSNKLSKILKSLLKKFKLDISNSSD